MSQQHEQLAPGPLQIKTMAGGGVATSFDPQDVTQYLVEELRAGLMTTRYWPSPIWQTTSLS